MIFILLLLLLLFISIDGQYDHGNGCVVCEVGNYCTKQEGSTACPTGYTTCRTSTACPTGYTTISTGSTSSSQCNLCNIGYYMSYGICVQCSLGYTTASTGSTSSSQCNLCNIGYYMSGSVCTQCSSGLITNSIGSTSVDQCLYLCSSSTGAGCCHSNVLMSSSVISLDNMALTPEDICPSGYTYNLVFKKCYKIYSSPVSWNSAQSTCIADGATLVNVQSEAESNFIFTLGGTSSKWIGFSDLEVEGTFKWIKNPLNLPSATQLLKLKLDLATLLQSTGAIFYARYEAENFNTETNVWKDSSSNSRDIFISQKGGLSVQTRTSNGQQFKVINGGVKDKIQFLCNGGLADYTLFHVARYTGGARERIFSNAPACDVGSRNWLSGFWYYY